MSAEVLRRAASLMREGAEATYLTTDEGGLAGWHTPEDLVGYFEEDGDADHIASWHPAVALAVADWLEATARELDALGDPDLSAHPLDGRRTAALAVARAYLGESS